MVTSKDVDKALAKEKPKPPPDEETNEPVETEKGDSIGGIPILPVAGSERTANMLIYGESGVGKTVLSGSADAVEEMSPVLLIDIEGGTLSLEDFYPAVKVVRTTNWVALQKVYDDIRKGKGGFKTVIIDSGTETQRSSMDFVMAKAKREDPDIDPDVPQIRHWGQNVSQTLRFARAFRDLPINTIFTALATVEKDGNTGKKQIRPMFQGKVAAELPGLMDFVFYLYIKEEREANKRLLLTSRTDRVLAKDRSNKLPAIIEDPTMELIYSTITGAK